jgi:hypothetical protein
MANKIPNVYVDPSKLFDPFYKGITLRGNQASPLGLSPTIGSVETIFNTIENEKKRKALAVKTRLDWYKTNKNDKTRTMRRRAYEFAYNEFKSNVRETPGLTNKGPRITESFTVDGKTYPSYQSMCGYNGVEWCACFTTWCYYHAGWKLEPGDKSQPLAGVIWWEGNLPRITDLRKLEPGDIVTFGSGNHVGMFSKWLKGMEPWNNGGNGVFTTIEGNTHTDRSFLVTRNGSNFKREFINTSDSSYWVTGRLRLYPKDITPDNEVRPVNFYRVNRLEK